MKREEAIDFLLRFRKDRNGELREVINMAIEALQVEYDEVKGDNKMTNYEVYETIERMIENSIITYETSRKIISDALNKGKIDENQYSDLIELSKKYL